MKNKLFLMILLLGSVMWSCSRVDANHIGVLQENYGSNGRQDYSIVTGTKFTFWFGLYLYEFPAYQKSIDMDMFKITAARGGTFMIDPSYEFRIIHDSAVAVTHEQRQYKKDDNDTWLANIGKEVLNRQVTNAYREAAREVSVDSLFNNQTVFEKSVEEKLREVFKQRGFALLNLTAGIKPSEEMEQMITKRNAQLFAIQQIKQEAETEKSRLELEIFKAEGDLKLAKLTAEKMQTQNTTLTAAQLQKLWIDKWDGKLPAGISLKDLPVNF